MDNIVHSIRLGYRSLARAPGFALSAALTLALGIGLSTAVFTVAEALWLRRLPVRDQDRIVALWGAPQGGTVTNYPVSFDEAREFTRQSRALEQVATVAFEGAWPVVFRDGERVLRLRRALVSGTFFDVLGTRPALGRALNASDDMRGAAPVVVLSHATWQHAFGGDPAVLGRSITLHDNGRVYRIVGVMPQGLDYPRGTQLWGPIVPMRSQAGSDSVVADVNLVGRLARGAAPLSARDELARWFARPDATRWERSLRAQAHTFSELVLGETRPALLTVAVAAALLLLMACINVANLLLVRGIARVREVAVRTALGARRTQIIAQLLVESALLAIAGGVGGVLVAAFAVQAFVAFAPVGTPRIDEVVLNGEALGGAVAITSLCLLLFALAPAIMASGVEPHQLLRSGTRGTAGRHSRRGAEWLVTGQVALAVIVLSASALVARSLRNLERAPLSLNPQQLLIGDLAVRFDQYGDIARQRAMLEQLLPALRHVPGVVAVSPVVAVPFSGSGGWDGQPSTDSQSTEDAAHNPLVNMDVVTPDYFAALGVPVLSGRGFSDADREGTTPVVVVSESAAQHYWPDERAIGQRLHMDAKHSFTVVGVVPDTRYRDLRDARPSVYFPLQQSFFPFAPMTLAIRATGNVSLLVPVIRRIIEETTPGVTLASAAPFASYLETPLAQPRLNALLLAVFAFSAVVLAAIGLYSVMSAMVRQHTRELGVRMALGATGADLMRMVVGRGLVLACIGLVAGLLGARLLRDLLQSLLYGVTPTDAVTLVGTSAMLLVVALLACLLPARASARIDPVVAMRAEG